MGLLRNKSVNVGRLIFLVVLVCVLSRSGFGQPWDGNGIEGDPYQIWTAEDMQAIGADANYWDAHFKLMADVDLGGYTGTSFNIIGINWLNPFTGVFDGNGHTVSNFTYDSNGIDSIGLFGNIVGANAEVKNLGLLNADVNGGGGNLVGSLVGRIWDGTISGCYVEGGSISGEQYVGGLVGNNGGYLTSSYSTSTVTGRYEVGGLVGRNNEIIRVSYSTGRVSGEDIVGGLVGCNRWEIFNCYSAGNVAGNNQVGGLVGGINFGVIINCYSTGEVAGDFQVGGLVGGDFIGIYLASFWDSDVNPDVNGIGNNSNPEVVGLSTAEMQTMSTYIDTGWDFVGELENGPSDEWAEPDGGGYPILWWQLDELPALPVFSGGSGEANDPYLISTGAELNMIGHNDRLMDSDFKLIADIDLGGIDFFPIGREWCPYRGVFDGDGYTISNFTYDLNKVSYIGLFGYINDPEAMVKNLGLIDPKVEAGGGQVGLLVGCLWEGTINRCYVEGGDIIGTFNVGGLVGVNWAGYVQDSYSTGSVTGEHFVGGLIGCNYREIKDSYSTGNVTGEENVGGLVGHSQWKSYIQGCYSTGIVTGENLVGGLVGFNWYSDIQGCYSRCVVTGEDNVGGLVGDIDHGTIRDSYSMVKVAGTNQVGGLVGRINFGGIINCYSTGEVAGDFQVGGLVGINGGYIKRCCSFVSVSGAGLRAGGLAGYNPGNIEESYSTGEIGGKEEVGGLVGINSGDIKECYSTGDVAGEKKVGGLVGENWSVVFNCYSAGSVIGNFLVGGLVGYDWGFHGDYVASFWDSDVNPDVNGIGNGSDPDVIGLPTVDMQTESTYTDEGWDFVGEVNNGTEDIWQMCSLPDYPKLAWEVCPIELEMKLTPEMVNCESKGNWVEAHFVLPEGYLPEDVDVNSPAVAEPVGAESEYIEVLDEGNGYYRIVAVFGREGFCEALGGDAEKELEVTVKGAFTDGAEFYGMDTIKLISDHWQHREAYSGDK